MEQPASVIELITPEAASGGLPVLGLSLSLLLIFVGQSLLWLGRASYRLGFDPRRQLGRWGRATRTVGSILLVVIGLRWTLGELPLAVAALLLLTLIGVLAATGTLLDVAGGMYAQLRLRLREGDRLRVGPFEGELRSLHWEHISLRTSDGLSVYVPNRTLLREPLEVYAMRSAIPLQVRVAAQAGADPQQVRDNLALMPYRVPGTLLEVSERDEQFEIRCYVWSEDAAVAAARHVQALWKVPDDEED